MADLAALQTKLKTFSRLTARLEEHRVAVRVAVELLHGCVLDGAGVAAGEAEGVEAGGTGLQQTQEQRRALARQARQQQLYTRVCGYHSEDR